MMLLMTREVFSELISQRLAQNFQLIVNPKVNNHMYERDNHLVPLLWIKMTAHYAYHL